MLRPSLSLDEAVDWLNANGLSITRSTMYTKIHAGTGPLIFKIGRNLRFYPEDLQDYLADLTSPVVRSASELKVLRLENKSERPNGTGAPPVVEK